MQYTIFISNIVYNTHENDQYTGYHKANRFIENGPELNNKPFTCIKPPILNMGYSTRFSGDVMPLVILIKTILLLS